MSDTVAETRRPVPRGVILIGILFVIVAFFVGGLGLLVPDQTLAQANLPRSLMVVGALVTAMLAYGLLRLRRWAWAATLSFVIVQIYFLVLMAQIDGSLQVAGLVVLLVIGIYLLLPRVRATFLQRR